MAFIQSFLTGGPFYALGMQFWNLIMLLTGNLMATTPQAFSSEAWSFVENTLYPWMLGLGVSLMNIFFFIGIFRSCSNLRQNITLEMIVETFVRLVLCNAFMMSGLSLIKIFFNISASLSSGLVSGNNLNFAQEEIDIGSTIFYMIFGIAFLVISLVCGVMVFLVIYGRYVQLYLLVIVMPLALGTAVGGQGISQTASAWIKTFLAKCFEIFIIALDIAIVSRLVSNIDFGNLSGIADLVDGAWQALQNIMLMVIVTASVKGADSFMRRAFSL